MTFISDRPFADPDVAARKLVALANPFSRCRTEITAASHRLLAGHARPAFATRSGPQKTKMSDEDETSRYCVFRVPVRIEVVLRIIPGVMFILDILNRPGIAGGPNS